MADFAKFFLKANDEESCDVISSLLQDSIFHITSQSFHEDKKCLRLMLNRFCWELLDHSEYDRQCYNDNNHEENRKNEERQNQNSDSFRSSERNYYRVHSGLYIHNVKNIFINDNFKNIKIERYLNLLAMHAAGNEINLLFSGHKHICVEVDGLSVYLKDLHDKYPTTIRSYHNI